MMLIMYFKLAYIANNMDRDQTVPESDQGSVFASMVKSVWSAFKYMQQML